VGVGVGMRGLGRGDGGLNELDRTAGLVDSLGRAHVSTARGRYSVVSLTIQSCKILVL
jgi:hypothetical protein